MPWSPCATKPADQPIEVRRRVAVKTPAMPRGGWGPSNPRLGGNTMHIRNPIEWGVDQIRSAGAAIEGMGRAGHPIEAAPTVRAITLADLRDALARGLDDFAAFRSDVAFLCVVYPLAGLVLARLVFGYGLLPLLFPLASGFALIGPVAAVG